MAITECPRDALQGLSTFVPTHKKIAYLRKLLAVGFARVDCVSFVSAKAIPQLQDSAAVLAGLAPAVGKNQLLAIVANLQGAAAACQQPLIQCLGYPLSLSETFQQRNTKRSIATAMADLQEIKACCAQADKQLLVFLSMGFGNPYGDKYDESLLLRTVERLQQAGLCQVAVADTVGLATPKQITRSFSLLLRRFAGVEIAIHLHARPEGMRDKIDAAYQAGCRRFDATLHGYGGCPMAEDTLVGNLSTQALVEYLESQGETLQLNKEALQEAATTAQQLFSTYAN